MLASVYAFLIFERRLITAKYQASIFKIGLTVKNDQASEAYFAMLLKQKAD